MKTNQIAEIIMQSLRDRGFPVFSTTVELDYMHEADVLGINSNDFLYEYEIKTSRGDFRNDFKKTKKHKKLEDQKSGVYKYIREKGQRTKEKRVMFHIPNRFYYACKKGLIKPEEIPKYAGLIYVDERGGYEEILKAPLLHKDKATSCTFRTMARILSQRLVLGCSYFRYKKY